MSVALWSFLDSVNAETSILDYIGHPLKTSRIHREEGEEKKRTEAVTAAAYFECTSFMRSVSSERGLMWGCRSKLARTNHLLPGWKV